MKHLAHTLKALLGLFAALLLLALLAGSAQASVDIGPMTWTQRSDWINVKNCAATYPGTTNAVGDGNADDTAAIQSVMTYVQNNMNWDWVAERSPVTIYFPPGTYKISSTLAMGSTANVGMFGVSMIGCGSSTIIKWASTAPIGPAMFAPDGTDVMRYLGFVWDGSNRAGCGIELNIVGKFNGGQGVYQSQLRIENSSFRNFTQLGTYAPVNPNQPLYGAGIAHGFPNSLDPSGESMIYNCRFSNCTVGVGAALTGAGNDMMFDVDGCEFDNCLLYGVYCPYAGDFMVTNCHFQNTVGPDVFGGYRTRVRHCTSQGSGTFYFEPNNISQSPEVIEDCWVDGWKGNWASSVPSYQTPKGPAVTFAELGPNMVFDSTFTHPPADAQGAVLSTETNTASGQPFPGGLWQGLLLSNNTAPSFGTGTGILWPNPNIPVYTDVVPSGQRGGLVSSPTQTFLKTTWPADSTHIIDVTKAPYTADGTGNTDSTATIQAAINAAQAANNGTIVYFPVGNYTISSTLTAAGGNYTLQGSGARSNLVWGGTAHNPLLAITSPQNITVQELGVADPYTCILETATGPSSATYDEVQCPLDYNNHGSPAGPGFVLSNLPTGSIVYLKHVVVPFTIINCGAAQILTKYLQFSNINVSGTTPQTGFLGVMEGEGGNTDSFAAGTYNVTINDNQDFVMNDYFTIQQWNDIDLERGSGTGTGRVSISGMLSGNHANATSMLVNNYAGRVFYTSQTAGTYLGGPLVNVVDNGTNPLDLIIAGNWFINGLQSPTLGTNTNYIETLGFQQNNQSPWQTVIPDTPNPLTPSNLTSIAAGLDHFRQLETVEASQQAGLVANWKLDEAAGTVSADSSLSGLNGTQVNSPAFTPATPTAIGLFDPGCLTFNGNGQYVSIPNSAALPSGYAPRTLCGWAKSNSLAGGWRWIASYGSPNTSQAMFIGMNGTTLYGGGYGDDLSVPNFWDGNWHFIALTYDGTTARLYADGALRASARKNWNLVPLSCDIGEQVNNAQEYWNGSIDDVRVYNRALSAADISSLAGH